MSRPYPAGGTCDIGAYEADHPWLSLTAAVSPAANVTLGSVITYTLSLTVSSAEPAGMTVRLTETLPAVSFGAWVTQPPGAAVGNGEVTWSGSLPYPAGVTLAFTAVRSTGHGTVTALATATDAIDTAQASASFTALGGVLLVDADRPADGDGQTWGTAYKLLQTALAAAGGGDEIWVAEGLYRTPPGGGEGPYQKETTFALQPNVSIYGGFAAIETLRSQRDPLAHLTVLSGDFNGNDSQQPVITNLSTVSGNSDNANHVVTAAPGARVDGLTITGGYASGSAGWSNGGGLYDASGVAMTLTNVSFAGNFAAGNGGALWNLGSLTLNATRFISNTSAYVGAGTYNEGAMDLSDATFAGNHALTDGAAAYSTGSFTMRRGVVANNTAGANAGGLYLAGGGNLTGVSFTGNQSGSGGGGLLGTGHGSLSGCSFNGNSAYNGGGIELDSGQWQIDAAQVTGNHADDRGGGLIVVGSAVVELTNSRITGNSVEGNSGGGVEVQCGGQAHLTNVLISGNRATVAGGLSLLGYHTYDPTCPTTTAATLEGVTIAGNYADFNGAVWMDEASLDVHNSVIWGNQANGFSIGRGTPTLADSDNQDGLDGCPTGATCSNVRAADPAFVAPADAAGAPTSAGNYRLAFGSPAIDAGGNTGCPATDLDGLPRPADGNGDGTAVCDPGAYEAGQMICGVAQGSTYTFASQRGPQHRGGGAGQPGLPLRGRQRDQPSERRRLDGWHGPANRPLLDDPRRARRRQHSGRRLHGQPDRADHVRPDRLRPDLPLHGRRPGVGLRGQQPHR